MHPLLDGLLRGNNFGSPQVPEISPTINGLNGGGVGVGGANVSGVPQINSFPVGRGVDNVGLGPGVNPLAFLAILYVASRFTRPAQIVQPIYIIDSVVKR
jgi:hypothetical protein